MLERLWREAVYRNQAGFLLAESGISTGISRLRLTPVVLGSAEVLEESRPRLPAKQFRQLRVCAVSGVAYRGDS